MSLSLPKGHNNPPQVARTFAAGAIVALTIVALPPISLAQEFRTAAHAPVMELSIPPQRLGTALLELARLTGTEIFIPHEPISSLQSAGVRGRMTPDEALDFLLRCTPYSGSITNDRIISIWRRDRQLLATAFEGASSFCHDRNDEAPRVASLIGSSIG